MGVGRGQNVGLRDFCHILTLLPPGASVFHKHMSCFSGPVINLPHTKDVGFMVYPSAHITTTANAKLQFDRVDRNDGQGYSVKTGIFSAPVAGMYHLFWNFLSTSSGSHCSFDLKLNGNGKIYSHLTSGRNHDTASGSIYLRLKRGDQVYIQAANSGGRVHSGRWSTFGGELIRY